MPSPDDVHLTATGFALTEAGVPEKVTLLDGQRRRAAAWSF
jgi:hypothetical protein